MRHMQHEVRRQPPPLKAPGHGLVRELLDLVLATAKEALIPAQQPIAQRNAVRLSRLLVFSVAQRR